MPTYTPSQQRRQDSAEARALILSATPEQLDTWRNPRESDARCVDRLLRIASNHPYEALAWMGAR
jgi:hypothetical protein